VSDLELRLPVHEAPGKTGVVKPPQPVFVAGRLCGNRPFSKMNRRRAHGSRRGLSVSGTAGEKPCAHATSNMRRRQRVSRVLITIYHPAAGGRCRFLLRSGRLSRPRSCGRPITYRARGTGHWSLRLRIRIPAGTYLVRSDAVDGYNRHQRHSASSVARIRVR
jgi:hypothetical protein